MKKISLLIAVTAMMMTSGLTSSPSEYRGRISPLKASSTTTDKSYAFDPTNGEVEGLATSLTESFDSDLTNFSSGNTLKAVPVASDYYDLFAPGHELWQEDAVLINETDTYYSLINSEMVGGDDGYFYQMYLTLYDCNYYFSEDLDRIEMYIPIMDLYQLDFYVRNYNIDYLKMPYFGINGCAYLDFTFENDSWTLNASDGLEIIGQTANGYYKISFPSLEKISSFSLFETHNYHSYYDVKESQFAERIGFFLPSDSMTGKYVSLPFDIDDIRFEEDCCVTLIADSFTGLICQNSSDDWTHDYTYSDEKGRGYHDWYFISREDWLPKASDSNQYLDSIDVEVTNNQSVIDKDGNKTENITRIEKTVNHTNDIGGPSGSLLYQYFPDFSVDDFTAGTIQLKAIHFYFRDISNLNYSNLDGKQTYDLSLIRKFTFTYDNRPVVRVAYVDAYTFDQYVDTSAAVPGGFWVKVLNFFKSGLGIGSKPDKVNQYYAFSLYFEEEKITKIPNVQYVVFRYTLDGQTNQKKLILNEENYYEISILGLISLKGYSVLDDEGMGFVTTDQIYDKEYVTDSSGVLHDYAFVYSHSTKKPLMDRDAVDPVEIWYQEDELSTLSQAVTNSEGLHIVDGQVFDKDNNLRLDYSVAEKTYTYEDGTKNSYPEIVDQDGNAVKPDTVDKEDGGDNLDDYDDGFWKFLTDLWLDICNFFSGLTPETVKKILIWTVIGILCCGLLGIGIRIVRWAFKKDKKGTRRKKK